MNLKFWQKNDDPFEDDALKDFSQDFSAPQSSMNNPHAQDPMGQYTPDNHPENVSFVPADQQPGGGASKENNWQYDVIIARLDSIKSQLDVLTHRVEQLEKQPEKKPERGPWYSQQANR